LKEIDVTAITDAVSRLCQEANLYLPEDVLDALKKARQKEVSPLGQEVLDQLMENAAIASKEKMPLCQDCGYTVVMLEVGQDIHIKGGSLEDAVVEGVRRGYAQGYLRKSIARQPFSKRVNTKDNTPPVIHTDIVPGDKLKIIIMPKGGGSENMSRLGMLSPSQGRQGVIDLVVNAVSQAGSNPCPPVIVGVGIGGTSEKAMFLAKKALLRKVGQPSDDAEVADLEKELLTKINDLGIGPQGLGGTVTALAVHVEVSPAHIASLPVGINIQCNSARHKEAVL
jgi:fumarate hydratase subunit alpha